MKSIPLAGAVAAAVIPFQFAAAQPAAEGQAPPAEAEARLVPEEEPTEDGRYDPRESAIIVTGALAQFGATKSQTPIVETARSISIETERDFRDKGFQTLDDALGYTAGVTAEPFGFATRGDFSAVRGLDVPEYRDNLQFLFGFYNNPRPDLYTLEQVEVLKGPASVLYGAGSPGGIINVVTKRPYEGEAGEILLEGGSFDRVQVATDLNAFVPGTNGAAFARLVALWRNAGTQIDEVHDDKLVVAPALTVQPGPDTTVTMLVNYTEQDTDTAHQFYPLTGTILPSADGRKIDTTEYFGEPGFNRYDARSLAITVIGLHRFSEALSFEGVGRLVDADSDYWQTWPAFLGTGVPRIDADGNAVRSFFLSDRRSEQVAFDVRLRGEFATGPIEHEVLAGVQYQDVMTDADNAFVNFGTINVFDPVYGNAPSEADMRAAQVDSPSNFVQSIGYYVSDQIEVGRLIATAGVRFDEVDNRISGGTTQRDSATSFSAGLLYRLPFGLSPYASYAESFQPVVGLDRVTGERLKPREGRQYEIGLKWQPPGVAALLTVAAFDIEESNLPNPQAIVGGDSQQEGISSIRGIEFEANAIVGGLTLDANLSYLDHQDPNGLPFSAIPDYQASVFGIYRMPEGPLGGLRFGGGVRHVGGTESSGISAVTGRLFTVTTDSFTVADAVIGYDFGRFDLWVNARNVTDEDYFTACLARGDCYPGERRTVVANLAWRF